MGEKVQKKAGHILSLKDPVTGVLQHECRVLD